MDNEKRLVLAIAVYAAIIVMIFHSIASDAQSPLPVVSAMAIADERPHDLVVAAEVTDFLIKSTDSRMMNGQIGLLAVKKSSNPSIRDFGERIMKDHSVLLEKIKKLAFDRNISLPDQLSHRKIAKHRTLSRENGDEFDKSFIKMIIEEHERDLKLFKSAMEYENPDVRSFAERYLPLIESDLKKITKIKLQLSN